jgi:hypothetical protein
MKVFISMMAFALCSVLSQGIAAASTSTLTHQGRLFDAADRPVDGAVDLIFALHSGPSGGTALWTETRPATPVHQGVYTLVLGEVAPIPESAFAADELFLSVSVGTDGELLPRLKLGTVPYAVSAARASDALKLGGLPADDYLTRADAEETYASRSELVHFLKVDDADATYARLPDLAPYLRTADAEATYMKAFDLSAYVKASNLAQVAFTGQPDGYLKTTDAAANYLTKNDASATYVTQTAASAYLSSADAATGYLSKADASAEYLTKAGASAYAPLLSPAFTGTPTAPTQATSNSSTAVATTAYVKAQGYLTGAEAATTYLTPAAASAMYLTTASASSTYQTQAAASSTFLSKTDASAVYLTMASASSNYLSKSSAGTTYAPLASPALTGTPSAPTPSTSSNSTTIATTAFVKEQGYVAGTGTSNYLSKFSGTGTVANSSLVEANGKLGVGVASPAETVDVAGNVQTQAILAVDGGAPTTYPVTTKEYIVEVTPAKVGQVVPLDNALIDALCRDKDGCEIRAQMLNWENLGAESAAASAPASRVWHLFISMGDFQITKRRFRFSENDAWQAVDNDSSAAYYALAWDCYLTDAESPSTNNAGYDSMQGWGVFNATGSNNDTTTSCRFVFYD